MNFWVQLFSDVCGQPSTNRLLAFFVSLIPLLTWSWDIISSGVWKEPSPELIGLITIGLGSKVVQRNIEQKGGTLQCIKEKLKDSMK